MVIFNSYVKLPGGVNPDVFHISGSHGSHGSQALETGNIVLERARRLAAKRREAPHGTLGTKRCVGERWPLRARSVVTWMRCSWHRISWNRSNKHGTFIEGWEGSSWNWWCFFFTGLIHSVASCWSKIRQKQQKVWGYHQNRKHPIVSFGHSLIETPCWLVVWNLCLFFAIYWE